MPFIKAVDEQLKALNQGHKICIRLFDVSKVFDKVPYIPLFNHLCDVGLDPYLFDESVTNCLTDLSVCGNQWYQFQHPPSHLGCTPGISFGPLLSITYINKNSRKILSMGSDINMFADNNYSFFIMVITIRLTIIIFSLMPMPLLQLKT